MIGLILGIIFCVFFWLLAIGAMVLNYEEHERRRKKEND